MFERVLCSDEEHIYGEVGIRGNIHVAGTEMYYNLLFLQGSLIDAPIQELRSLHRDMRTCFQNLSWLLVLLIHQIIFLSKYGIFLSLFRPGFFFRLKVQGGSLGTPVMISGTIKAGPVKLCTVISLSEYKRNFQNVNYDVKMTSLLKQWQNSDLRETRQIIYHSKGNVRKFKFQ